MDPRKVVAEWFRKTVFREEAIRPRPPKHAGRLPSPLQAARSLENGPHQSWQSRESVFMKQGKLLATYEDSSGDCDSVVCYYPTYQSLTDRQLRAYFGWRTRLRRGEIRKTSLSFAFLYIYELINQIGVPDPMSGYNSLLAFQEAYGRLDGGILHSLGRWIPDYVVYYGLDPSLLSGAPQAVLNRSAAVLDRVQEAEDGQVMDAVRQISKWLGRSKFYAECREDMDRVTVRVLRRMSAHYAARCKKTLVEQYLAPLAEEPAYLFDSAVFCNPLKRANYRYDVDGQWVYRCENGFWYVQKRDGGKKLDVLLKTIDSAMRQARDYRYPVKAELNTKWVLRLIQEEIQALSGEPEAAGAAKITIDFGQLAQIRRDAASTQEKLIVDEELDLPPEGPLPEPEPEQAPEPSAPAAGASPLAPAEYRLLQCLLYGRDTGWVQREGLLLSVLADGVNEKLYDQFLDCVLDGDARPVPDYIDDLKEMVRP